MTCRRRQKKKKPGGLAMLTTFLRTDANPICPWLIMDGGLTSSIRFRSVERKKNQKNRRT